MEQEVRRLRAEVQAMASQARAKDDAIASLERSLQRKQVEAEQMAAQLAAAAEKIAKLEAAEERLVATLGDVEAEFTMLYREHSALRRQAQLFKDSNSSSSTAIAARA